MQKMFSRRFILYRLRRFLRWVGKSTGTPHQIALGMCMGFISGWTPFMGAQMVIAIVLCHLVGANKVVPLFPVWLTNPVTYVPVMAVNYWVGWMIVGGPPTSEIITGLSRLLVVPQASDGGNWLTNWWEGIKFGVSELFLLGWDMVVPLMLGSLIVGGTLGLIAYILTKRFVISFRQALHDKKRRNRERRRQRNIDPAVILSDKDLGVSISHIAESSDVAVTPGNHPSQDDPGKNVPSDDKTMMRRTGFKLPAIPYSSRKLGKHWQKMT